MARPPVTEAPQSLVLKVQSVGLTDDQFFHLAHDNDEFRMEMTAEGELVIMPNTGMESGWRNANITATLAVWTRQDATGLSFDSSTMFTLPNGAKRSADACWISKVRWRNLPKEARKKFAPICPDFVIELRSETDELRVLKTKMDEYIANGAQMGWLLDPFENRAYIYKAGKPVQQIESPASISGDSVLPGFQFDFREILNPPE